MLFVMRYCLERFFALIQMLLKLKYSLLVGRKANLKGVPILDLNGLNCLLFPNEIFIEKMGRIKKKA